MRFFDYIRIAFKNLSRQKLRTFLTTIAVVIGAVAVTALISVGQNVSKSFVRIINDMGILSMVTVSPDPDSEGGGMLNVNGDTTGGKKIDETTITAVKKINHIEDVTPMANLWFETMRLSDGSSNKKVRCSIMAFDPDSYAFSIEPAAGRALKADDVGKIIIGQGAAKNFGYGDKPQELVGKKALLSVKGFYTGWGVEVPKPPENGSDENWRKEQEKKSADVEVEIIGVAAATGDDYNNYTNMEWARAVKTERQWQQDKAAMEAWQRRMEEADRNGRYLNEKQPAMQLVSTDGLKRDGYNALILKVDDPKNTDSVVIEVQKMKYGATTAKEMIDQILKMIKIISEILAAIGGLALVVAAIGIINTMAMAIFERTREIGVMRACGATRATVRQLFTLEATLIGFLGGALGVAICYGAGVGGDYYMEKTGGISSIPIESFVYLPYWLIGGVIGFTTFIALFAGLYPAFKAAKLNPVEALRSNK